MRSSRGKRVRDALDRQGRSAGAVRADQVHLRGARGEDGRAVRRPGEELPELRGDPSLARAVRVDDPDVFPRPDVPGGSAIAASEMEQSSLADENTIRVPSGDHAGHPSSPGAVVRRRTWLPPASITKMLQSGLLPVAPGSGAMNAIREPSGDHAGYST